MTTCAKRKGPLTERPFSQSALGKSRARNGTKSTDLHCEIGTALFRKKQTITKSDRAVQRIGSV
jgi:hypothetical protein